MEKDKKMDDTGIDKEIGQKDSIKEAEDELKNSLYFYRNILSKMEKDLTCYECKKNVKDIEKTNKDNVMMIVPVRECDKGMWAAVAVCSECQQKMIKKQESEPKKE